MRLAVILTLCFGICEAGTRDEGVPDSKYLAEGREYRHVVGEISGEIGGSNGERHKGTCVAFAPHYVLTAAHVIDGCKNLQVEIDGSVHVVDKADKCPEWTRNGIGFGDIAVCRVRNRFRSRRFPPLRSTPPKLAPVVVAGYGFTGRMSDGPLTYDGNLRAGTNEIARLTDDAVICNATKNGTAMEYHIESGDSGGPLFGPEGEIIGIHSSTLKDVGKSRSRYGDESVHTRVDRFHDWIEKVIAAEGTSQRSPESGLDSL